MLESAELSWDAASDSVKVPPELRNVRVSGNG